jgi:DNA gyrase subunit A
VKKKYADPRRSEIIAAVGRDDRRRPHSPKSAWSSRSATPGYIKRTDTNLYRKQRAVGRALIGAETKEEDWVEHLFVGTTHDYLMFFTNKGQAHWLKVWELPRRWPRDQGTPDYQHARKRLRRMRRSNPLSRSTNSSTRSQLVFVTRKGQVQRNMLSLYSNPRKPGIKAINIGEDDKLVAVKLTTEVIRSS